jgi:PAS domain S-box-containing protein
MAGSTTPKQSVHKVIDDMAQPDLPGNGALTVLIVDNSREDRTAARLCLSEAAIEDGLHITILEAATYAAGLAECRSAMPGCILLDHSLPDMTGLDFLALLAGDSGEVPVPVVMMTGSADKALTAAALRAGAQEYLPKQFAEPELLLRAVQSARERFDLKAECRRIKAEPLAKSALQAAADETLAERVKRSPGVVYQARRTAEGRREFRFVSDNVEQVLGYTAFYIMTDGVWDGLLDQEATDLTRAALVDAIRTGHGTVECWITHGLGHRIRVSQTAEVVPCADGGWLISGVLLDVTALHEANIARFAAERRATALLNDSPSVVYQAERTADGHNRLIYVSDNALRITGHTAESILANGWDGVLDPEGRATRAANLAGAIHTGHAEAEAWMRHGDGRSIRVRTMLRAVAGAGGTWQITGNVTDITALHEANAARMAADQALDRARRDMDEVIAVGPGCLYRMTITPSGVWDLDYASDSFEPVFGYTLPEVSRPGWLLSVLDPAHIGAIDDALARVRRREKVAREFRIRSKSGGWTWISETLSPSPQTGPDGSLRLIGYAMDITELKQRAEQLQQSARMAMLGEMATGAAHELRQPLAGISFAAQNAEFALDSGNLDSVRTRLGRIIQQTERASAIIEHMRLFGRGSDPDEPAVPVSLDAVMQGTLGLVGEAIRLDSIELTQDLGQPALSVVGHQRRLEQVLVNLMLNARDAIADRADAGPRRIGITAERSGDFVRITVADTGGGIPADLLPRMFQPFVTTKLATKGTGLGLSICHGLIGHMGGDISVRNNADGAVFTIKLPAA